MCTEGGLRNVLSPSARLATFFPRRAPFQFSDYRSGVASADEVVVAKVRVLGNLAPAKPSAQPFD